MEFGFSLGSNLGDRINFLKSAKDLIQDLDHTFLLEYSPIYETSPVNVNVEYSHLNYYNAFIIIESSVAIKKWWTKISCIEENLGRIRNNTVNSPRTIDIDLIYANSKIINSDELIIPHPRWFERLFVLKPFSDVRPDLILPGVSSKVKDILDNLKTSEKINLIQCEW
tara:strand:- start:477 stop:980 length:504 start_codon:yes stop_codon:yes gene_type:complete